MVAKPQTLIALTQLKRASMYDILFSPFERYRINEDRRGVIVLGLLRGYDLTRAVGDSQDDEMDPEEVQIPLHVVPCSYKTWCAHNVWDRVSNNGVAAQKVSEW